MHKYYFPRCPVDGPITPPKHFSHLGSDGAVPRKCANCDFLFEGSCARGGSKTGHYLHLDHGPCGIEGPTDPVIYENQWLRSHVEVPRKCATCVFLGVDSIYGFHCKKDAAIWGDFHRSLDWGYWEPDCIWIQLPHPKITTRPMMLWAKAGNLAEFIKEYRRTNADLPLGEAKTDYQFIRNGLGLDT